MALVITKDGGMGISGLSFSIIVALVSMVCYGFSAFIPALMVKKHSPLKITAWSFLMNSVVYGALGLGLFSLPVLAVPTSCCW